MSEDIKLNANTQPPANDEVFQAERNKISGDVNETLNPINAIRKMSNIIAARILTWEINDFSKAIEDLWQIRAAANDEEFRKAA